MASGEVTERKKAIDNRIVAAAGIEWRTDHFIPLQEGCLVHIAQYHKREYQQHARVGLACTP
jgi:hypothetical protein